MSMRNDVTFGIAGIDVNFSLSSLSGSRCGYMLAREAIPSRLSPFVRDRDEWLGSFWTARLWRRRCGSDIGYAEQSGAGRDAATATTWRHPRSAVSQIARRGVGGAPHPSPPV